MHIYCALFTLTGTGSGLTFAPSYVAVSQYFDKKKGKAMGIATLGVGLGTVALAPTITLLFSTEGYYGAMIILSAVVLHCCIAGALFRPPPAPTTTKKDQKQNGVALQGNKTVSSVDTSQNTSKCEKFLKATAMLRDITFLLYCLQVSTMSINIQVYVTFLPGITEQNGISKTKTAWLLCILGISDMVGRFLWGVFFDLKCVRYR